LADFKALHLRHGRNEDVSAFFARQVHSGYPKVLPFQPQLLAIRDFLVIEKRRVTARSAAQLRLEFRAVSDLSASAHAR
jgi:hypothetical protein